MIASKVTFGTKTKEMLNYRPLSVMQKSNLRRRRVMDYVRELPSGTQVRKRELITAAGYNPKDELQYASGHSLISGMLRRGEIAFHEGTGKQKLKKRWYVPSDIKTVKKPEPRVMKPEPKPELEPADEGKQDEEGVPERVKTLEEVAKDFAWETNSDSLREFIAYARVVKWG